MKRPVLIGMLTSLLPFLEGCKTKQLEYLGIHHARVEKLGFPQSTLSLEVSCYNPNRFGLRLTELNSDVFVNDEFVGKASIDSGVSIPKLDTFDIPVKLDVKTGGTLKNLLQMMQSGGDSLPVLLRLEGKAHLRKSGVGFDYPIRYEEKKSLRF